jgi:U3 small nucleolar RNA-associated protein 14
VAGAEGELQLADLLEGLGEQKAKLGSARKLLDKMGRSAAPVSAPLPRQVAERVSRKAGYESASKEVSKWQPLVKVG